MAGSLPRSTRPGPAPVAPLPVDAVSRPVGPGAPPLGAGPSRGSAWVMTGSGRGRPRSASATGPRGPGDGRRAGCRVATVSGGEVARAADTGRLVMIVSGSGRGRAPGMGREGGTVAPGPGR